MKIKLKNKFKNYKIRKFNKNNLILMKKKIF